MAQAEALSETRAVSSLIEITKPIYEYHKDAYVFGGIIGSQRGVDEGVAYAEAYPWRSAFIKSQGALVPHLSESCDGYLDYIDSTGLTSKNYIYTSDKYGGEKYLPPGSVYVPFKPKVGEIDYGDKVQFRKMLAEFFPSHTVPFSETGIGWENSGIFKTLDGASGIDTKKFDHIDQVIEKLDLKYTFVEKEIQNIKSEVSIQFVCFPGKGFAIAGLSEQIIFGNAHMGNIATDGILSPKQMGAVIGVLEHIYRSGHEGYGSLDAVLCSDGGFIFLEANLRMTGCTHTFSIREQLTDRSQSAPEIISINEILPDRKLGIDSWEKLRNVLGGDLFNRVNGCGVIPLLVQALPVKVACVFVHFDHHAVRNLSNRVLKKLGDDRFVDIF